MKPAVVGCLLGACLCATAVMGRDFASDEAGPGAPAGGRWGELQRGLLASFSVWSGWNAVRGEGSNGYAEGIPALRLARFTLAPSAFEDGTASARGFVPFYPVRRVILENRRQHLRNENHLFRPRIALAAGQGNESLVTDLEGRYGNSLDVKWVASQEEAVRLVKIGESPYTFLDSDLALVAAAGDADLQVSWKWLEPLAPVRLVGWRCEERVAPLRPGEAWEKTLRIRLTQWLADRRENSPWKGITRAFGTSYAGYLTLLGSNARGIDAAAQAWRLREANEQFEKTLAEFPQSELPGQLKWWAPVLVEYLTWGGPFEVKLAEIDRLAALPTGEAGAWLEQIRRRAPQVWERWTSLRGMTNLPMVMKTDPASVFDPALTPEDRRLLQRLFWRRQGETLLRAGKFDEACSLFERILSEDPDDPLAKRAWQEASQKRDQLKRETMARAAILTAREAARMAGMREDEAAAQEAWMRVLAFLPGDPEARQELAILRENARQRERREELSKLQKLLEQGIATYNSGHPEAAISYLEALLDLAPGNAMAQEYLDLARGALAAAGDEEEDPRSPYADVIANLRGEATALWQAGQFDESEAHWRRILTLFPRHREALIGSLRCREKKEPGSLRAWADGRLEEYARLKKNHRLSEAQALFEFVRTLVPDHPVFSPPKAARTEPPLSNKAPAPPLDRAAIERLYEEAMSDYSREDLTRAREIYRSILSQDSNQVSARLFLDRIETRMAFGQGSNRGMAEGEAGGRGEILHRLHQRALDLYNQGRVLDAITEWERILKLDPDDKRAQNSVRRAQALRRQQ